MLYIFNPFLKYRTSFIKKHKIYKYYKSYNIYGDYMNTTISITKEIRDKIKEFGMKGESYSDILERLYNSAVERQLQDLLMDTTNCIPVSEALERSKKRWQK